MRTLLSFLPQRTSKKSRARRLGLEHLEDRVTPAGNILVANAYTLKEYTPAGTLVRSVPVGNSQDVRDLSVSADGDVHIYNGTFNPVNLRTYDSGTLTWGDRTLSGWSTVANVSYGGNAHYNGYVFVTDMNTGPTPTEGAQGIIRFDLPNNTATRFATNLNPWDLNIGLDGKLYTFGGSGTIAVFDPVTMAAVRTVTVQGLPSGVDSDLRALAVDASGNIYIATWGSKVIKLDPNGVYQKHLAITGTPSLYGLTDIDIASDGDIIIGSWGGVVVRTSIDLNAVGSWFSVGNTSELFVTYGTIPTAPPPPGTATLGDRVWRDSNANGVQDSGEPGIPGVAVKLMQNGTVALTATTDTNGVYSFNFSGLTTSTSYWVELAVPSGYTIAPLDQGANDATDNDFFAGGIGARSGTVTVGPGTNNLTVDAGFVPTSPPTGNAVIGDRVWNDTNANGVQDANEPGIAGVTVKLVLSGSTVQTKTTDAAGNYSFTVTGLTGNSSSYWVEIVLPTGYTPTSLNQGGDDTKDNDFWTGGSGAWTDYITVGPNITNTSVDAGLVSTSPPPPPTNSAVVGDRVWRDANGNGIQDTGETGVAGVTVRLYGGQSTLTATTDANGNYSFTNLAPSPYYYLQIVVPSGYNLSPLNVGNDALDNDFYSTSAWTDYINVTAGSVNNTNDAGLVPVSPPPTPTVSVADVAVLESDSSTVNLQFTVRLSNATNQAVTMNYTTADGTATAGIDYTSASGSLSIPAGQTTYVINVPVLADTLDEKNETIAFSLSNLTNATFSRSDAAGWIADEDPNLTTSTLTTNTTASLIVRDFNNDGVFESTASGATTFSVRKFNFDPGSGTPTDERAILEFPLGSINPLDIGTATLQLNVVGTANNSQAQVWGYQGDGTATGLDGSRGAVLLASFSPTSLGQYTIPLDLAGVLNSLPGGTTHMGIRVVGIPNANFQFYGTSHTTNYPRLLLGVSTTPTYVNVADASVNEGDYASVTISLSQPHPVASTMNWYSATGPNGGTSYGTATLGTDFINTSGQITFAAGETSKTVLVPTVGDAVDDSGETFTLIVLDSTGGVVLGDPFGLVTINDVANPTPGVRISDASVVEGSSGTTTQMVFTVTLSVPGLNPVTLDYATGPQNLAISPQDYQATSGTVTFAPGETTQTISVTVNGDNIRESLGQSGESFRVTLSNLAGGTMLDNIGIGTITDDDPPPVVSVGDVTVTEGNTGTVTANVPITLSNPADVAITVNVTTTAGTAFPGADFVQQSTPLTYQPGETTKTLALTVYGDGFTEDNETFNLIVSSATGAGVTFTPGESGLITVLSDDPTSGTMAFTPAAWGYATDGAADGTYESSVIMQSSLAVNRTANGVTRSVMEYDVARVVEGDVTAITFGFTIGSFTSSSGPVNVVAYSADGVFTSQTAQADVTAAGTVVGTYPVTGTGRQLISLNRDAILAITGGSNFLGLRFEPGASTTSSSFNAPNSVPFFGMANTPVLTFRNDPPPVPNITVNDASARKRAASRPRSTRSRLPCQKRPRYRSP